MTSFHATLLAIDDDRGVLRIVERFAQRYGFKVSSCTDARAALAELAALKPEAGIVDHSKPAMNGLDVIRAIRDVDRTCRVILMTGQSTADTAAEAIELGAFDFVSKPFDLARFGGLLTGLRKSLDGRGGTVAVDPALDRGR
jgi:DNA-binding NtrC family response regulator